MICNNYETSNTEFGKHRQEISKSLRIIVLCVLVILFIVSTIFACFSWDIAYSIKKSHAAANSETYRALLDEYEESEDFLSFAALYDEKYLYGIDAFDEYRYVYMASSEYQNIFGYISTLLEPEKWEDQHENALKNLCDSLEYFYEYTGKKPSDFYFELDAYNERHTTAVSQISEKIENLLQMTFSITEEEMTLFKDYSIAEKQVFIERRFEEFE